MPSVLERLTEICNKHPQSRVTPKQLQNIVFDISVRFEQSLGEVNVHLLALQLLTQHLNENRSAELSSDYLRLCLATSYNLACKYLLDNVLSISSIADVAHVDALAVADLERQMLAENDYRQPGIEAFIGTDIKLDMHAYQQQQASLKAEIVAIESCTDLKSLNIIYTRLLNKPDSFLLDADRIMRLCRTKLIDLNPNGEALLSDTSLAELAQLALKSGCERFLRTARITPGISPERAKTMLSALQATPEGRAILIEHQGNTADILSALRLVKALGEQNVLTALNKHERFSEEAARVVVTALNETRAGQSALRHFFKTPIHIDPATADSIIKLSEYIHLRKVGAEQKGFFSTYKRDDKLRAASKKMASLLGDENVRYSEKDKGALEQQGLFTTSRLRAACLSK